MSFELLPLFPVSTTCEVGGQLCLAGHQLSDLANKYGTPLYIYDAVTIRRQVEAVRAAFAEAYPGRVEITYAAKAYFSLGIARRLAELGLGVDVVSLGEMMVARQAGFSPQNIHLHGNNKSDAELNEALHARIGAIVVDSIEELEFLADMSFKNSEPLPLWLRVNPGVLVDTHAYRQTGHRGSKFGLSMGGKDCAAVQAIRLARDTLGLELVGLHVHIGSQLFQTEPYQEALHLLFDLARQEGFYPPFISPGGGWGVPYTLEEPRLPVNYWADGIASVIKQECQVNGWPLPILVLELGRWIIAQAGVALYEVGFCKTGGDGTRWVAVDGGMGDNMRVALYGTRYSAMLVERAGEPTMQHANIVGKFCESGDVLISDIKLPEVHRGDHLAVPMSGAYHLSMASNYNMAGRPAVLCVEGDEIEVMQPREHPTQGGWWVSTQSRNVP